MTLESYPPEVCAAWTEWPDHGYVWHVLVVVTFWSYPSEVWSLPELDDLTMGAFGVFLHGDFRIISSWSLITSYCSLIDWTLLVLPELGNMTVGNPFGLCAVAMMTLRSDLSCVWSHASTPWAGPCMHCLNQMSRLWEIFLLCEPYLYCLNWMGRLGNQNLVLCES